MSKRWRTIRKLRNGVADAFAAAEFWLAPNRVGRRRAWQQALRHQEDFLASREAADVDRFRGAKWLVSRLSPDSEAERDLETVRKRAWELYLNDPIASGYVKGRVSQIVGTGLRFQARLREARLISPERARELNTAIEAAWKKWSKRADRIGRRSIWQLQRLMQRCIDRDGEVFVVLSDKPLPGKPVPLVIEVVASNRVATPPEKDGDPNVRLGIEKDADGTIVAYYIRTTPPADTKETEEKYERVPADRVCHVFEAEEPDQSRGWPSLSSSMAALKDLKDHDEAVLVKRQTEACFAAFIKSEGNPLENARNAAAGTTTNGDRLEEVVPGMIRYMGPGEEVTFSNPGASSAAHSEYMDAQYHRVAAGLEYPHELLCKAYGKTSWSSGRLSLLDGRITFRCAQRFLVEMGLEQIAERFVEELVLFDVIDVSAVEYIDAPDDYTAHAWIPPGWPWVDPVKEVTADEKAVANKFDSRAGVNAGRGLEDEEVQEQRLREQMLDADNEKKLLDYRKSIGLDKTLPNEGTKPVGPSGQAPEKPDDAK